VGGLLEGSGGPLSQSIVTTERADYANFHLRVETMMPQGLFNAIYFRMSVPDGQWTNPIGTGRYYATSIAGTVQPALQNAMAQRRNKTGALLVSSNFGSIAHHEGFLADPEPNVATKPGEWFFVEVIADGDVITVIVGGVRVAKVHIVHDKLTSGAIGISCRPNSKVVFRKIEIKELDGAGKSAGVGRRPAGLTPATIFHDSHSSNPVTKVSPKPSSTLQSHVKSGICGIA
jgi:Domain of Unknown Function (DUF1080)